jgi:hypothetical protein
MSITRFAVLPDERRLMLGIDKANLFEAGQVYEATELLGQIIIKKIGPYILPKQGPEYPNENSDANTQIYYGQHLISKEEWKEMCNENLSNGKV